MNREWENRHEQTIWSFVFIGRRRVDADGGLGRGRLPGPGRKRGRPCRAARGLRFDHGGRRTMPQISSFASAIAGYRHRQRRRCGSSSGLVHFDHGGASHFRSCDQTRRRRTGRCQRNKLVGNRRGQPGIRPMTLGLMTGRDWAGPVSRPNRNAHASRPSLH